MLQIKILIEDQVLFYEINHIPEPAMHIKISFDKLNSIPMYASQSRKVCQCIVFLLVVKQVSHEVSLVCFGSYVCYITC
jgi:hypothetical protein